MSSRPLPSRIQYIDAMRGAAVVAMFFVHSAKAWLAPEVKGTPYWIWSMRLSGMVAPIFLFLVGISMTVIATNRNHEKFSEVAQRRGVMRRGLKILLLGYLLHTVFFLLNGIDSSPLKLLKVDILHCIGVGLIVSSLVAWPRRVINYGAIGLFLVLPLVGHLTFSFSFEKWLPLGIAAYLTTKPDLALFPIIPYGAWIAFGLAVGPLWIWARQTPGRERRFWPLLCVAALMMFLIGKGIKWTYFQTGLHSLFGEIEPTRGLAYLFFYKGSIVLLVFAIFRLTGALFPKPILRIGRTSLFAYAVHLPIIYHLAGRFAGRSLVPHQHLIGVVGLTTVMWLACLAWSERRLWSSKLKFAVRSVIRRESIHSAEDG